MEMSAGRVIVVNRNTTPTVSRLLVFRKFNLLPPRQDKYQLSQMDPRYALMLQTGVDDQCDKLAVDRRKYCQRSSINDRLVYHTERPHLSRPKSTTRCNDRRAVANF